MRTIAFIIWIAGVMLQVIYLLPNDTAAHAGLAFFYIAVTLIAILSLPATALSAWQYLRTGKANYDYWSAAAVNLGLAAAVMSAVSGSILEGLAGNSYWNWEPWQMALVLVMLIYGAYPVIRTAYGEQQVRSRLSAVYSLWAFGIVLFILFAITRYAVIMPPPAAAAVLGAAMSERVVLYILFCSCCATVAMSIEALAWTVKRQADLAASTVIQPVEENTAVIESSDRLSDE